MSIVSKIQTLWTNIYSWMTSPWTTFSKVRKSPITWILMIFFVVQPIASVTITTIQDIGWIKKKVDPEVSKNQQRIQDLEKRVAALEKK